MSSSGDFGAFSDKQFSSVDWINSALRAPRTKDETIDARVSMLVMKLQLLSQDVSNALEEISAQALESVPRSMGEIENIGTEALNLQSNVKSIMSRIEQVEDTTKQSVEFLSAIDSVKARMESTCITLREANSMKQCETSIEEAFLTNNPVIIAEKLETMQHSLEVLKGLDEYSSGEEQMLTMKNRLEKMVAPQLIAAFNRYDLQSSKQFALIYKQIRRDAKVHDLYCKQRQSQIEELWNAQAESGGSFATWIKGFYDELLLLLNREKQWCADVFGDEAQTRQLLVDLLIQSFAKIAPLYEKRLGTLLSEGSALTLFLEVHTAVEQFSLACLSSVANTGAQESLTRAMHQPLSSFKAEYGRLEKQQLIEEVKAIPVVSGTIDETVKAISNSISPAMTLFERAVDRCVAFTGGVECEALVSVLSDMFQDFLQKLFAMLQHMRRLGGLEGDEAGVEKPAPGSTFQVSLQVLEECVVLGDKVQSLDMKVRRSLAACDVSSMPFTLVVEEKASKATLALQGFVDSTTPILQGPVRLARSYVQSLHRFVFDAMLLPVRENLSSVVTMECWKDVTQTYVTGVDLPSFSLPPQKYITDVGQNLLTVPQQFEAYSSNEALSLSTQQLRQLLKSADGIDSLGGVKDIKAQDREGEEDVHYDSEWITALTKGTSGLFIKAILDMDSLGDKGARQLAADIGYLNEVISALCGSPEDALVLLQECMTVPGETYTSSISEYPPYLKSVAMKIAGKRALKITEG